MSNPLTIWSHGSLPLVPPRYRSLYRVLLPIIDCGIVLFGVSSLIVGSHIVDTIVTPWASVVWSCLCLGGALVALSGLVLMRDRVELFGRFAVGIGLLVYIAATTIHVATDSPNSILTLILTAIRIAATVWRMNDLVNEISRKEAAEDD